MMRTAEGAAELRPRLTQAPGENALLHMQPVFRLVPDDRLRAVDDSCRHLFAALRREAMHEYGLRLGFCHQPLIHAVRGEQVVAVDAGFRPPPPPGICDDAIRAGPPPTPPPRQRYR